MGIHLGNTYTAVKERTFELRAEDLKLQQQEKRLSPMLPAEWYPQSGVQLTWPHPKTDWAYMLAEVEECFINIAREIAQRELLLIVTPHPEEVMIKIGGKVDLHNVRFLQCNTNDTWARDHGAITLMNNKTPLLLDFKFNGWGLKFAADKDNLITHQASKTGALEGTYVNCLNFVLEGGSIESDGLGTVLTTSECLLSPNRNGEMTKEEIETYLKTNFFLKQVLWLDHGYLAGDDTDSHIDTLARICPNDTIAYVACNDETDEHYTALKAMEEQLKSFTTPNNTPYRLLALPMADAIYDEDNERLPATYANFLILNKAVIYPTYNQPAKDEEARKQIQLAFPDRDIIGVDSRTIIRQHGSIHCLTMQLPEGALKGDRNDYPEAAQWQTYRVGHKVRCSKSKVQSKEVQSK